jgi:hypothetical protein
MKIILIIALFLTINCVAQTPDFQLATSAGEYSWDMGRSVAADKFGNIYLTGDFESPTITFGEITLTNANDNSYSTDIFLVKYNAEGNVVWAKGFGGYSNDYAMSVSSDPVGNIIIAGGFNSPSLSFGTVTLVNDSADDAFVVKFDNSGNVLWANEAEGIDGEGFIGAADSDGNFFISGDFYCDTLTSHEIKLINTDERDIFVAKLNASGNFQWAKIVEGGNCGIDVLSTCAIAREH